jgi:hypothetical protein
MTDNSGSGWGPPPPGGGYPQYPPPPPGYPPYPPAPQPVPPRKRPVWPWILGAVGALVVITVAAIVSGVLSGMIRSNDDVTEAYPVTYEITGAPGDVEVTYHDDDGRLTNPERVTLPWKKVVTSREAVKVVSVQATRVDGSEDPLTCRITSENGVVVSESQAVAPFANCSGLAPEK